MLCGGVLLAGYPWAAWLLAKNPRDDGRWLTLLVGFAFSLGALTLVMFWEAGLGLLFDLWTITLPMALLALVGLLLWGRQTRSEESGTPTRNSHWLRKVAGGLTILVSATILFNAAYWPFSRPDVLGIYGRYGRLMWITQTLVSFERDDFFYQTYPVLVPLTYPYAYLASGWQNEYLAHTISTLMSLACLPAVYLLARMMAGWQAAWLSMVLLALTPTFSRWASSGYVDLPMAFFFTMSAIFAWRVWYSGHWTDALLAGAIIGLAAWTKNAGLFGVALLFIWLVLAWIKRGLGLKPVLSALVALAVIAAPWYIRNMVMAGMVVPPTAWTDQAQPTLDNLLNFVTHPENFGITGYAIALAIVRVVIAAIRRRMTFEQRFILFWTLPYFVVWWLLLSYDPRFQLLFLPMLTVLAGIEMVRLWQLLPVVWQRRLQVPLAVGAVIMAFFVAWNSIEFKGELLREPFMGDDAKRAIVLEDR